MNSDAEPCEKVRAYLDRCGGAYQNCIWPVLAGYGLTREQVDDCLAVLEGRGQVERCPGQRGKGTLLRPVV